MSGALKSRRTRKKEVEMVEEKEKFTTLDVYLSSFLALRGHVPKHVKEREKIVFCFEATDRLFQDISEYQAGASVDVSKFVATVKILKSRIFAMRRKEDGRFALSAL